MLKLLTILLVMVITLGLLAAGGYAQSEVQTESRQLSTQLRVGGGLLVAWGTTWPLARLSVVRGRWRADLDLWGQSLRRLFLMPAMRADLIFDPYRFHVGIAPIVMVKDGRPQMLKFLLAKGGLDFTLDDIGPEVFTEAIFLFAEGRLSPFPAGFIMGVSWRP